MSQMLQNLVVIAANGEQYIHNCLRSLGDKYPVLVVDTFSDEPLKLDGVEVCRLPFKGFSTSAYLWAYWHYPAKNYLFLQDSVVGYSHDYLKPFIQKQPKRGAVAWALFNFNNDSDAQSNYVRYLYSAIPEFGLFGPIFYVSRNSLDELRDKGLLPPTSISKEHDMASERLWAMAFKQADMKLVSVGGLYDQQLMINGDYPVFKKEFPNRQ